MTEYSGRGDPARTMDLLWGMKKRPSRGPKPGLGVEEIVRVAVEVADVEGLEALSMRRVAERLGISTMSLYTYVPGKAELVDIMLDRVMGEAVGPENAGWVWRERLEGVARQNWDLYRRHPWLLKVAATSRPPLGPNVIAKYDQELRAVDGIGLTDVEMDSVLTLVLGHVEGAARRAAETAQVRERTGNTDYEWWSANAPLLEKVFDAERYPVAARVGSAAGAAYEAAYSPEHAFEFGLERVLDGIEELVRTRAPRSRLHHPPTAPGAGVPEPAACRPMIDHVTLWVRDITASRRFYETVLAPLGLGLEFEHEGFLAFGSGEGGRLILYVGERSPSAGVHLAFSAPDRESVDAFHAAALKAGGQDNGAPGLRPQYHGGYYGAYVFDSEGNNVEAVHHTVLSG